jgi:aspartate 1-decarboxylase
MWIEVMKSKIHRLKVTRTELHYIGSITLPLDLMEAANIYPNEKVQVLNLNTGARIETYVIQGERNSGEVILNGPAARLFEVGDTVIVISYALIEEKDVPFHQPKVIFPDENNRLPS